jgi:parallel beta-helix repeat protein
MVLALVVAGFTVVGGGQALASDVGCGDTITTDTTLDSDLVNCPNNGIIIGADNITLDLNGHTIDGDGAPVDPCPEGEPCDIGVLNVAGHDRLSIVGGTVQQFGVGVLVEGAAHPRLHQLAASDNTDFGIIVAGSTDPVIEQTSMSDNGTSGLVLVESRGALVARNTVSGSNGYAIFTTVVDDSRIQNNALDGNDHGIAVLGHRPMTTDKHEVAGPRWVRTASGTAGPRWARAVSVGERESQVTRHSPLRPRTAE